MKAACTEGISEQEFEEKLVELIGERPVKIWLATSTGRRLDTTFAVGHAASEPIKMFDHIGGFYLLGESVPKEWVSTIHEWFSRYCQTHKAVPYDQRQQPVHVDHYGPGQHHAHTHTHFVMHYPYSASTR